MDSRVPFERLDGAHPAGMDAMNPDFACGGEPVAPARRRDFSASPLSDPRFGGIFVPIRTRLGIRTEMADQRGKPYAPVAPIMGRIPGPGWAHRFSVAPSGRPRFRNDMNRSGGVTNDGG